MKQDKSALQVEMKKKPQPRETVYKKESETKIKRWMLERLKYKVFKLIFKNSLSSLSKKEYTIYNFF